MSRFNLKKLFRFKTSLNVRKILIPRKRKFSWKRFSKKALYVAVGILILIVLVVAWFSKDLPTPGKIARRSVAQSTKIYDRSGETVLYETGEYKRTIVKSDQVSDYLKEATVAVEDANFYRHHGFDARAVAVAVWEKITNQTRRTRGGSTITQQFIKNALLSSNRTLTRKIKELILATELEIMFDKDEILTMYLNEIPYGGNTAGAEAAAKMYYGIPAKDLSLAQAATLAAIPRAPTYYSPYGTHTKDLVDRRNYVLDRMVNEGNISKDQSEAAKLEDTTTVGQTVQFRKDSILAPHFAMYVIEKAVEEFGEEKIQKEGLKITTSLDYEMQKKAEQAVASGAAKLSRYGASNAALVAVDPKTGQILAMVGSLDYFNTEIDGNVNVADSLRQPGSSFKPFAYATAFKKKEYSPAKIVFDLQTDFGGGYVPRNYDGSFEGPVTMRYALANSLNIPAIKTLSVAGLDNTLRTAEEMGISTLTDRDRYGLSLVLGAGEVKPVEMAGSFGVFANGGTKHDLKSIIKVEDARGKIIYEYKDEKDKGREVLDPQITYEINSILSDNKSRSAHMGSNSALNIPGKNVAVKTGTTSSFKDAWTIGYSTNLSVAVWVGNNDATPMSSGAAGLVIAAPIFNNFMTNALGETEDFPRPKGIQEVSVDKMSTKLPSEHSPETITDIFTSWQVPNERDDIHIKVKICKGNELLAPDNMPASLVEEKLYTNIHSLRPDYPNWEGPVRAWAQAHGMNNLPPTEICNPGDLSPKISITAPTAGSSISGTSNISASVSANYDIKEVNFYLDNISIYTDKSSPYETSYNFNSLSNGEHSIAAIVTDTNNATAKDQISITVAKDESAPQISSVSSSQIDGISYKITWTTDEPATSQVIYGTTSDTTPPYSYTYSSTLSSSLKTSHSVTISISPSTKYYFRVKSKDVSENLATSNEYSFTVSP